MPNALNVGILQMATFLFPGFIIIDNNPYWLGLKSQPKIFVVLTALLQHHTDAGNNLSAVGTADYVPAEFIPLQYPNGIYSSKMS